MDIIYQLLDRYLEPNRSSTGIVPSHGASDCAMLLPALRNAFPSPQIFLYRRRLKNSFKDSYFDHQSQLLTPAIIPTVIIAIIILSNYFSLRNYLLHLKTPIRFKFLPSVVFMNPLQIESRLCLSILNKTPTIF